MERTSRFQRNQELERLLAELNGLLEPAERDIVARFVRPTKPVVLVVGAPRSGTTLLMQWLAETGQFAYPSNLLSRFFRAPYIGAMITQLIGDPRFNYGDELWDHSTMAKPFSSELGKTRGMFEPNEFWYFWRRFFPVDQAVRLSEDEIKRADVSGFLAGIASMQAVFEKPWAMKGILLQYNLAFLDSIFDSVLFLHTVRNLADNAQSILRARHQYFGTQDAWFSVRPEGYQDLLQRPPTEQVVGQVVLTNQAIDEQLKSIHPTRFLRIDYESFCRDPLQAHKSIHQRLASQGFEMSGEYHGPNDFQPRSFDRGEQSPDIERAIESIARHFSGGTG
jgi:hypothetical protein